MAQNTIPYTSYGDYYDFSLNTLVYKQDPKYKTTFLVPETAYTTSVKRGSTYNYATYVYINKFSFPSGQNSYLYIDWNQDEAFSDSTERYTPGTITVPANAKLGKTFIRTAWLDYASHTPVNASSCAIHQFMITVLPPDSCASFNLSFTKTNTRCYGDSTGRISLKPSGGTAPYTYTWTDGDANQVRDNLSAGTYQVTARDAKGCDRSTPVLAIQSPFLIQVDTTAVGDSLIINVSGGTGPYSYIWTNASGSMATPTATGLPTAGTYTLSISDASTCSVSYSGIVIPKKQTTALALREASKTLKVYPNPTQSEIHILSSHVINKVVIVDLSGKQVFSKTNITNMQTTLNISSLPASIYLVKAFTEIGVETNQVIKQ